MTARAAVALALAALWAALCVTLLKRRLAGPIGARFFGHRGTAAGVAVLAFFAALALAAPLIAPYRPSLQLDIVGLQNQAPSWRHFLGTDVYSRDLWSRIVWGARVSLGVGALATLLGVGLAALVGACAGYFQRRTDAVLMRLVDVGLSVPRMFLVLVVLAVGWRPGALALALLLGLTGWFAMSRLVRAEVMALRELAWVDAARTLGAGPWRIIARHILPNAAGTIIVCTALGLANMMLTEAALSFLGVGVQPPAPSWGNMIADGREQLATAPWSSAFPGIALTLVVMALNSVADALRDTFDPALRN